MIRHFTIENFCSFRHPAPVSFVVGKNAPDNTSFRDSINPDERISTLLGVFGPNASGKTNLIKGLAFLSWFIHDSYEALPIVPIPVAGFRAIGADQPTRMELEYEADGTAFRYRVELSPDRVLSETLSKRGEHGRFSTVLHRQSSGSEKKPPIKIGGTLSIPLATLQNTLRENSSIVSTALQTGNRKLAEWVAPIRVQTNLRHYGRRKATDEHSLLEHAARRFFEDRTLFSQVYDILTARADLGITRLEIDQEMIFDDDFGAMRKALITTLSHSAGDLPDFSLKLIEESSGTKRLFLLLSWILPALRDGVPVILDELESDLHPHMLPWLLRLFSDPETNPAGAQLLFTCHSAGIMNRLDKTQIALTEKDNRNGTSEAWRLDEVQGVRRDDNLFAKYNAGSYGAVPEPL